MDKLVISDDEGHTTVVPLLRDEITIGRNEGNTIRLTERNVSRSHARLLKRNGSYIIEDLGSYNGVTLNGERIDAKAELAPGDQLGIGDYGLAFQAEVIATANTLPSPKPRSQPPPRLIVLNEPAAGAEFTLNKPTLRIGRDERLDIWINHKSISHEHAELQVVDGKVTVFDLESANGVRVNGVDASRAVLESGDVLELGEVRFRFLPPQGVHSLEALPQEAPVATPPSTVKKPVFVISVIALLALAGAGAVLTTMRGRFGGRAETKSAAVAVRTEAGVSAAPDRSSAVTPVEEGQDAVSRPGTATAEQDDEQGADPDGSSDEPREWEGVLGRARRALGRGHLDRAYAIADGLPPDSVLRKTPEFREIRYRYAQALLREAQRALAEGDLGRASNEAGLVLALEGITSKQRQDAKRLMRSVRGRRPGP